MIVLPGLNKLNFWMLLLIPHHDQFIDKEICLAPFCSLACYLIVYYGNICLSKNSALTFTHHFHSLHNKRLEGRISLADSGSWECETMLPTAAKEESWLISSRSHCCMVTSWINYSLGHSSFLCSFVALVSSKELQIKLEVGGVLLLELSIQDFDSKCIHLRLKPYSAANSIYLHLLTETPESMHEGITWHHSALHWLSAMH